LTDVANELRGNGALDEEESPISGISTNLAKDPIMTLHHLIAIRERRWSFSVCLTLCTTITAAMLEKRLKFTGKRLSGNVHHLLLGRTTGSRATIIVWAAA